MTKLEIRLSKKALQDLDKIWLYSFNEWSRLQADEYLSQIYNALDQLLNNPEIGNSIHHIRKGYRSLVIGQHIAFYYRADQSVIDVVRILHHRRDINNII